MAGKETAQDSRSARMATVPRFGVLGLAVIAAVTHVASASAQTRFLGPSLIVNDPAQTDSYPSVDSNAAGTTVVAWHCDIPGASAEICVRRISLTGRPMGPEQIANTSSAGIQQYADVAVDDLGNHFVVWESNAGEDGDDWTVLGRLFAPNGTPIGGQRVLNSQATGRQRSPAVAWRPGHGWIVAWDSTHAGFPPDVYARRFSPGGQPQGAEFLVSQEAPGISLNGLNTNAAVESDASGAFVVVWQGPRSSGGSEVFGRRYTAGGAPRAATFRVATLQPSQKQFPSVGVAPGGEFVIVFSHTDDTVAARRYRSDGQPRGAEFQVNQSGASPTAATVAMRSDGGFVVAWTAAIGSVLPNTFSVRQRAYAANGQPLEGEQLVDQRGQAPVVALDAAGDAQVAYHASGPDAALRLSQTSSLCIGAPTAACVQQGRLKVEAAWRTLAGEVGVGQADLLTDETATFWFFTEENVELVLKGLEGCGLNQNLWVFAAGATDVEIDLAVTDTTTATQRRYFNPLGRPFETVRDTSAFPCGAAATVGSLGGHGGDDGSATATATGALAAAGSRLLQIDSAVCAGGDDALCLNQNRFLVELSYVTAQGVQGQGSAVPLSGDSGYFYFFGPGNVELLVKVLDACGVNQRHWVFAAGLTDLQLELEVTDTAAQQMRRYTSQGGQGFGPVLDSNAFATCP